MKSLTLLFLSLFSLTLSAETVTYTLDLSKQGAGSTFTEGVKIHENESQEVGFQILNLVPTEAYNISAIVTNVQIPPFSEAVSLNNEQPKPQCASFEKAYTELRDEKEEANIPTRKDKVEKAKASLPPGVTCPRGMSADQLLAKTIYVSDHTYFLSLGQELEVMVTRIKPLREWKLVLSTGDRGSWRTSYGFNFVPNDDEEFFTKQASNNEFIVTKKVDRQAFDFAPSVFFTWLPKNRELSNWSFGPAGGVGFDLSNPILFAGYSFFYNQNIGFIGGLAIHKVKRLDGKYSPGDPLTANLESSQLELDTYRPNGFFGITFRFSSNPFKKEAKPSPPASKPKEETPKP